MGQSAYMWVDDGFSEACGIGRGVRQGCSLSSLLYIISDEAIMKATKKICKRVSSFLTAHQHILGYIVPYIGENVTKM